MKMPGLKSKQWVCSLFFLGLLLEANPVFASCPSFSELYRCDDTVLQILTQTSPSRVLPEFEIKEDALSEQSYSYKVTPEPLTEFGFIPLSIDMEEPRCEEFDDRIILAFQYMWHISPITAIEGRLSLVQYRDEPQKIVRVLQYFGGSVTLDKEPCIVLSHSSQEPSHSAGILSPDAQAQRQVLVDHPQPGMRSSSLYEPVTAPLVSSPPLLEPASPPVVATEPPAHQATERKKRQKRSRDEGGSASFQVSTKDEEDESKSQEGSGSVANENRKRKKHQDADRARRTGIKAYTDGMKSLLFNEGEKPTVQEVMARAFFELKRLLGK